MPKTMKRLFTEITSRPHAPAPQLFCPACQLPLVYRYTVYGGVDQRERWDSLACRTHGMLTRADDRFARMSADRSMPQRATDLLAVGVPSALEQPAFTFERWVTVAR